MYHKLEVYKVLTDTLSFSQEWKRSLMVKLMKKHLQFIYSLSMKTIFIHIFEVRKLWPFIYYTVIGDQFIY